MRFRLRTVTFLRDEATTDYGIAGDGSRAVQICRSILATLDADREHAIVTDSRQRPLGDGASGKIRYT